MSGVIIILLVALAVYWYVRRRRTSLGAWKRMEAKANAETLAGLGSGHDERMRAIDAMFEAKAATRKAVYCAWWSRLQEQDEVKEGRQRQNVTGRVRFAVSRNLAGLDHRELKYLRVAEELNSASNGSDRAFRNWRASLIWGDGKGVAEQWQWRSIDKAEQSGAVAAAIQREHMSVEQTMTRMQQFASQVATGENAHPGYRAIMSKLSEALAGGSSAWLKSSQLADSPYAQRSDYALRIGSLPDGEALTYSGDGSMVTIAPPGAGKTQCHVYPNLLSWPGPAVVLDISGDIYEHTAAWRAENVGPVYRFSPLEPDQSHRYNPLTFVRRSPDYIWEDSRLLAEMMIVPALSADPFWENEARTVLTAAIAYVCYSNPPEERPLRSVLDILFGGEPWNEMMLGLRMAVDVHTMTQHATALSTMNEKTLSSVLQTARSSLASWAGERVARSTAASDWSPEDLRGAGKPTVYIYIRPNEVESYLSLLRVFIGQHIRVLTAGDVPAHGSPPVLFMLDELPRLRSMPPVDEALNIGRKYGLRMWMFAQSVGQFQDAYSNADGMLGACAVRIYMNPGGADGLAEKLSEELGYIDSISDNSRRRLVEASTLAGPDYRDLQIVFASGGHPATATKHFAYNDPELSQRMAMHVRDEPARSPAQPLLDGHDAQVLESPAPIGELPSQPA
jgi:type IV secretion system protein VirD4